MKCIKENFKEDKTRFFKTLSIVPEVALVAAFMHAAVWTEIREIKRNIS